MPGWTKPSSGRPGRFPDAFPGAGLLSIGVLALVIAPLLAGKTLRLVLNLTPVADETSMVDALLMNSLLRALPPSASLLLAGNVANCLRLGLASP